MRLLTVVGLSEDGSTLLLREGEESFAVDLDDVKAAQRPAADEGDGGPPPPPPSPREIQTRIRYGESADHIAAVSGLSVDAVTRYAGPVLAEREHQAQRARAADVDGRPVGELVAEHMARVGEQPSSVAWDCWLTDTAKWELTARAGRHLVRLRWDSAARKVKPLDEGGRQALLLGPAAQDALGAVLRPLSSPPAEAHRSEPEPEPEPLPEPEPAGDDDRPLFEDVALFDEPEQPVATTMARPSPRRGRASVPAWDDIATQVAGRPRPSG